MKVVYDGVSSFLGGVNTSVPPHRIGAEEVVSSRNLRSTEQYGSLVTRAGSKRLHSDVLPAAPTAIGQWDAPGGTQEFAFSGGDLYYKDSAATVWTRVALALDETLPPGYAVHRSGSDNRLFFGDGTSLYTFDGATASVVAGAPSVRKLEVYKARGFGIHTGNLLHASAVDDLTDWSISSGGLTTPIQTYDADDLNGILVIGGSLILTKENNVSRYSGVGVYDTRVETNTDGISAEVGLIAPQTLIRVGEDVGFMLTDRGPYLVTESGVREAGMKVEPSFDWENRGLWSNSVAVHNRRRREVWLFTNLGWWVFNYRTQSWSGPWDYQAFSVSSASRYERSSGQESVMAAGTDGFVRDGDFGAPVDDVLFDGTGGAAVPVEVRLRDMTFGHPTRRKNLSLTQTVTADLGATGELQASWTGSDGREVVTRHPSAGAGVRDYTSRPKVMGERIEVTLSDESGEEIRIDNVALQAKLGRRVL